MMLSHLIAYGTSMEANCKTLEKEHENMLKVGPGAWGNHLLHEIMSPYISLAIPKDLAWQLEKIWVHTKSLPKQS